MEPRGSRKIQEEPGGGVWTFPFSPTSEPGGPKKGSTPPPSPPSPPLPPPSSPATSLAPHERIIMALSGFRVWRLGLDVISIMSLLSPY